MNNLEEEENNLTARYHLDTEVNKLSDDLYSIKLQSEETIDESDEKISVKTFLINVENDKLIDLQDIFDNDKDIFYFTAQNVIANDINVLEVPVATAQLADYLTANYYDLFITDEMESKIEQAKIEEQKAKEEEIAGHKYIAFTFDDGTMP